MKQRIAALALSALFLAQTLPVREPDSDHRNVRHVLLFSIDGMHAVDFANCVSSNTCPNLVAVAKTGINYTRTTTSRPSDSFSVLMALVSGGK